MPIDLPAPPFLAAALAAVLLAGAVRGFTGFGSAIVMAPILGPLFGPATAVPTILSLDFLLNLRLVPQALPQARWGLVARMTVGSAALLPLGAWLIVHLPKQPLVIAIGVMVILAALVIWSGWQYRGPVNAGTDIFVGGVAGFLGGSTSIGGPPVVLYLLARPATSVQYRADLIGFLGTTTIVALLTFALYGTLTVQVLVLVVAGLPVYLVGSELGRVAFWRVQEERVRSAILLLLMLNGGVAIASAAFNFG